ncbi:transcription initiation factor TFIID subunit 7-like, partial [Sycon ciliatum]|uniref:transcription initiation factor TFIID subunit 7-like n=1 Tax=Sycon ciliatum TaxID=27933 RepID=UPI0031F67527
MRTLFLAFLGLALLISLQDSQGASVDQPSLRSPRSGDSGGEAKRAASHTTGGDGDDDEDEDRHAAEQDEDKDEEDDEEEGDLSDAELDALSDKLNQEEDEAK